MKNISRRNIGGFTLVELLIVVLIIGILSAVALPMYQGAVDKSRFSSLLPAAKSIKNAEESVRAATGNYTDNMQDLEVNMENEELNFAFDVHNNLADPSLFRITNPKLENVRLAVYFDFNPMMAGQMHCEAKAGNERANRLCGPLLQGQELGTTTDGYNRYLLDDDIDKATCDGANRSWSSSKGKCYKDTPTRCEALGMPVLSGEDECGYTNNGGVSIEEGKCVASANNGCRDGNFNGENASCEAIGGADNCHHSTFQNGAKCVVNSPGNWGCMRNTFTSGSICEANTPNACYDATFSDGGTCISSERSCYGSKFNNGGICQADAMYGCARTTFNEGSKCIANAPNTCCVSGCGWYGVVTYNGGCCEGPYCPADVPKC